MEVVSKADAGVCAGGAGEAGETEPLRARLTQLSASQVPSMAAFSHVFQAIYLVRMALYGRVPLIGFTGGPWTLFVSVALLYSHVNV